MLTLPHNIETEQALLGTALLYENAPTKIMAILKPVTGTECIFYTSPHREIFKAVTGLYDSKEAINAISVQSELAKRKVLDEVGGLDYLFELTDKAGGGIEKNIKIIGELYLKRQLIQLSKQAERAAHYPENDPFKMISRLIDRLNALTDPFVQTTGVMIEDCLDDIIEDMHQTQSRIKTGDIRGLTTGTKSLDHYTDGFYDDDYVIIAARPGMGKTAFMLTAANQSAKQGNPEVIYSLESTRTSLIKRLISQETGIENYILQASKLEPSDWRKVDNAYNEIRKLPIIIDECYGLTIQELESKARKYQHKFGVKRHWVDYLQLMTGNEKEKRIQNIDTISRRIRMIAGELKTPFVALSQLNRGVESRTDKKPLLSDLRESGSLEQDATRVIMLYRPAYYGAEYCNAHYSDLDPGTIEKMTFALIKKQRNGQVIDVPLYFHPELTKFEDIPEPISHQYF